MKPGSREAAAAPQAENLDAVNDPREAASKPSEERTDAAPAGPHDRELVQRVQAGDEGAFHELFQRYHRRAYAVAFGVVKARQDALDIVQDAFIKVHRHIGTFQGSSSFYTWLYRIVMNLAIDHVRRGRQAKDLDYDDKVARDSTDVAGDGTMLPRILDGNPRKTVMRKELMERILKALDELPEYHRRVIIMREWEGLSYEEMAKELKVPKGTIMSRLFHARRKMQEALREYLTSEIDLDLGE